MNDIAELNQVQVLRLPLWKACLDDMRASGIEHGKYYPTAYFEEALRVRRDTIQFGTDVSAIRRELEGDGFYLSGYGMKGEAFVVIQAHENVKVMERYQRQAMDCFKRAITLGTNTDKTLLDSEQAKKHDHVLSLAAVRYALARRSSQVAKALKGEDRRLIA